MEPTLELTTSWELAPNGQVINFPGLAGWLVGKIGNKSNLDQLSRNLSWWWAELGKKQFWKQTLCSVGPIMQGALFCHPENIVTSLLWDNPKITRNNKPSKRTFFTES